MDIRNSTYDDLPRILELYEHARHFMRDNGNPRQWTQRNWPPEELIRQDIATGKSYVCEHQSEIAAVFFFDQGHSIEPTYVQIDGGQWMGDEQYGVVHRIASTAKGAGTFCLEWAYDQCGHLRIDTHGDNVPMQNLLKKLGFSYCGIIHVNEDQDPRLAFERI